MSFLQVFVLIRWGVPASGELMIGILDHTGMLDTHFDMVQQVIEPCFQLSDMVEKNKMSIKYPRYTCVNILKMSASVPYVTPPCRSVVGP